MKALMIKRTAFELFAKKGFSNTTMNDIAFAVGIKKPSIYAHFSSKEILYTEILKELADLFVNTVQKIIRDRIIDDTELILKEVFKGIIEFFDDEFRVFFWRRAYLENSADELFNGKKLDKSPYQMIDNVVRPQLISVIKRGMQENKIKRLNVERVLFSYHCEIDGYLNGLMVIGKDKMKQDVEEIWEYFWCSIKN